MTEPRIFPMQWAWRLALWMLPTLGAVALVTAGAELLSLVERGTLLGEARDAERWVAVAVGAVLLPFGLSALPHARLTVDGTHLRYLGFGLWCTTRSLALADVRRWGHAVGRNQGRREPQLLFELRDGSLRLIKSAMYARQGELLRLLTERLGPPTAARATMSGVRFEE